MFGIVVAIVVVYGCVLIVVVDVGIRGPPVVLFQLVMAAWLVCTVLV